MGSRPEPASGHVLPAVVAATGLEARAVRRALPGARVVRVGVGLSRLGRDGRLGGAVVACGLAGALAPDLDTGAVLVPDRVLRPDGSDRACDAELVAALVAGARRLGLEPDRRPLLTTPGLAVGTARARLAATGCAGVDMETALLDTGRLATVRVVLDTPERELSAAWRRPATALLRPSAWAELPWLAREGPRCARLAAAVLAAAFG
jgi:4-hydroxy-3-methylbut-2-en-1-yl diphosphate reductase